MALWRAMHVQVDPPPHVLKDEIGLQLAVPGPGWRHRPDMDPAGCRELDDRIREDGCALCPACVKPCGLKNALEAGRQSSHTAAAPISQVSTGPIRPSTSTTGWLSYAMATRLRCESLSQVCRSPVYP